MHFIAQRRRSRVPLKYRKDLANIPIFSEPGGAQSIGFTPQPGRNGPDRVWRAACSSLSSET